MISCAGRFHAYDLAGQLEKRQLLQRLITTYPKIEIRKFGLPDSKVRSLLYWEIVNRVWGRVADLTRINRTHLQYMIAEMYDLVAPSFIPDDAEIFIGWSCNSERGLKRAKSNGTITILERGSSHIEVQTEILDQEYSEYYKGEVPYFTHQSIIDKEMREYELADYISVPSTFVKRSFIQKGIPESKLIQNLYGVNLSQFQRLEGERDRIFRVIFVGQLSLRKGTHYLLRAFSELNLPNAELLLVGGKNHDIDPFLEKYKSAFRYIGSVPQRDLSSWYSMSDVFCIPSLEEGFAMVQAQAMACGLPIICTTNTGGEDIVEDGKEGFIIPVRNVDAIKERILWMYENREACKSMGERALLKVAKGFTWDDYGKRYAQNIHNLVRKVSSKNNEQ